MSTPPIKYSNLLLIAGILLLLFSCHRYFMPVQQGTGTPATTGNFIAANSIQKYFILRKGNQSAAIQDIVVDQQTMTLSGRLSPVQPIHRLYLEAEKNNMKYKDAESGAILNEVHIYLADNIKLDSTGTIVLPLDQVVKIEVIQHDRKRTNSSYILGGVGIGLGVMVLAGVIIALTKSSCPFISVYDGRQYNLQGELFGGAVNARLERTDYVPLLAAPVNGQYELRISNELRERQYTNFADLLIAEHSDQVKVLPDENGNLYSIGSPDQPVSAILNGRENVLTGVIKEDNQACLFNDSSNSNGMNELLLRFRTNRNQENAKLVLRLKNAYWFDYLYGEFTRKFGSSYSSWQEEQKKKAAAEMIRWTEEQQIPLAVSLLTHEGWKLITNLKTVGPIANRSIVIPLTTTMATGDYIQVRIKTGFMFWELDYAGLDTQPAGKISTTRISPVSAQDEKGNSVLRELLGNDDLYLAQPEPGNYATITYNWNKRPDPGNRFSVILHTRGYYEPIRDYKGIAMSGDLIKFREPGALARFSLDLYRSIPAEHHLIALEKN